jgi:hypothetical protein
MVKKYQSMVRKVFVVGIVYRGEKRRERDQSVSKKSVLHKKILSSKWKKNEKLCSVPTKGIHRATLELTSFDRILVATRAATAIRVRVTLVARLGFIIIW